MSEEVGVRRQPASRWARKAAWVVIPLALLGETGHHLLQRTGAHLVHHFFHYVFIIVAGGVFALFAAIDIRRNGRPTFSWRLRDPEPPVEHTSTRSPR